MTTGEAAEEVVENIAGVTKNYIEQHEEAAKLFSILTYILGGLSLFGLWASIKVKKYSNFANISILIFALIVMIFAKQTGTTGGEIRHTEIRSTNNISIPTNSIKQNEDHD